MAEPGEVIEVTVVLRFLTAVSPGRFEGGRISNPLLLPTMARTAATLTEVRASGREGPGIDQDHARPSGNSAFGAEVRGSTGSWASP